MSYFVTGTDTGIGKTVVSTLLALGLESHYWKPIQTGASQETDSDFVRQWIPDERIFAEAYRFGDPLSPHLAAQNAGAEIDVDQILRHRPSASTIIEGAGGVLVPLNRHSLMIDLIRQLACPVIVVASTRLGTINHTLLTLGALRRENIEVRGVVMVGKENRANAEAIAQYGEVSVLGTVPPCTQFSREWFVQSFQQLSLARSSACQTHWI